MAAPLPLCHTSATLAGMVKEVTVSSNTVATLTLGTVVRKTVLASVRSVNVFLWSAVRARPTRRPRWGLVVLAALFAVFNFAHSVCPVRDVYTKKDKLCSPERNSKQIQLPCHSSDQEPCHKNHARRMARKLKVRRG